MRENKTLDPSNCGWQFTTLRDILGGQSRAFSCENSSNIHYLVFLFTLCAVALCVLTLVDLEALANSSFGVETEESLFKLLLGPGTLAVPLSTCISSGNDAYDET